MSFSILSCRNKALNSRVRVLFSHFYKIGNMVEEDVNLRSATSYWKYFYRQPHNFQRCHKYNLPKRFRFGRKKEQRLSGIEKPRTSIFLVMVISKILLGHRQNLRGLLRNNS